MDRIAALILLLFITLPMLSVGQCQDDYIKVVTVDSCKHVEMGVLTYAEYYHAKKNLAEIKKIAPSAKKSLDSLHKAHNEYVSNVDSIAVMHRQSLDSMYINKEQWREFSYRLEEDLVETECQLNRQKRNRPKWFGGGALTVLILILLL